MRPKRRTIYVLFILLIILLGTLKWFEHVLTYERMKVERYYSELITIKGIRNSVNRQFKEIIDYLLFKDEDELSEYNTHKSDAFQGLKKWKEHIEGNVDYYPNGDEVLYRIAEVDSNYRTLLRTSDSVLALGYGDGLDEAVEILKDLMEIDFEIEFLNLIQSIINNKKNEIIQINKKREKIIRNFKMILIISAGVTFFSLIIALLKR